MDSDSSSSHSSDDSYEDFDMEKMTIRIQTRINATTASLVKLTSPVNTENKADTLDRIISDDNYTTQDMMDQRHSPDHLDDGRISPIYDPVNKDNNTINSTIFTPDKSIVVSTYSAENIQTPNLSSIAASPSNFSLPKSPNSSLRRGAAQQTFERMYREAEVAKLKKEQLRIVTELERDETIKKSSFM